MLPVVVENEPLSSETATWTNRYWPGSKSLRVSTLMVSDFDAPSTAVVDVSRTTVSVGFDSTPLRSTDSGMMPAKPPSSPRSRSPGSVSISALTLTSPDSVPLESVLPKMVGLPSTRRTPLKIAVLWLIVIWSEVTSRARISSPVALMITLVSCWTYLLSS